jgi:uncharacterized protein DUF1207
LTKHNIFLWTALGICLLSRGRAAEYELQRLPPTTCPMAAVEQRTWQVMPMGLIYRSYLAGAKEPRFCGYWSEDDKLGALWDTALGGRLGLLRYGTLDAIRPEGVQIDIEGGVHTRLQPDVASTPLIAADFRIGFAGTWATPQWQFKTGYYHISSHLGDEYLLMNPGADRINYTRDSIVMGAGYFWTESLRLYGESAYAVGAVGGAQPWEFQFGSDWAPASNTGLRGAPFAAINAHVREELDFSGNFVLQAGWSWRGYARGSMMRIGLEYFNGYSDKYEFFDQNERRFGWGMWFDF